jgi:hypothetical protein
MKLAECILYFDLFAQKPDLLINKKTQMRTILGLIISFITYIIFLLILLYELQEVIYKQNPNIITNKFDSMTYNSSFRFNNDTFKLVLVPDKIELLTYFKLDGTFLITYLENGAIKKSKNRLSFSKCEAEELDEGYKDYFKKNDVDEETVVCIRNLYSDAYENITNFDINLEIEFRQCMWYDEGCQQNETIYEQVSEGRLKVTYQSLFKWRILNVFDNAKPFYSYIKSSELKLFSTETQFLTYSLGINELWSNENYIINKYLSKESHLDIKNINEFIQKGDTYLHSNINFKKSIKSIKVTVRNYKSLMTAIANSFSLIRLALYIMNKFVKYHVKYSIEEVIIGRNFYYDKIEPLNNTEDSTKVKQSLLDKKPFTTKLIDISTISNPQQKRLSMKDIYLSVSCWRFFLCRRRNKTVQFYNKAKNVVNEYLSAEYLLYNLLELKRLKYFNPVINCNTNIPFDPIAANESYKIAYINDQNADMINNDLTSESLDSIKFIPNKI